jgi:hypothetical protein
LGIDLTPSILSEPINQERLMNRIRLAASVLALAFGSALLTQPALAESANNANAPKPAAAPAAAPTKPDVAAIMKFSQDGNDAIRAISAARVAIFNGDPKLASDMIAKAKTAVAKAEQEAPTYSLKVTTSVEGKTLGTESETEKPEMVPVDGQLTLADDFVPTPEKQKHIAAANEHFKNGKSKEALEELRLGEVEVMYNRIWMPLASTSKHIEQAMKLMDEHKYYEANLALKAIGDSLTVDSVKLTETPKKKS